MLSRAVPRRLPSAPCRTATAAAAANMRAAPMLTGFQRRWVTPAPREGDGPLMSRRADRELPDLKDIRYNWARSLPIFLAVVAIGGFGLLNYEKMQSPVTESVMYALRTSPRAREVLGDEIYFKSAMPWIRGGLSQVSGRIDVRFAVRGSRAAAMMRFASCRPSAGGVYETSEWSLTMDDDGRWVDLLQGEGDPFRTLLADGNAPLSV